MAYTGPIPPQPTATSTDAQWNTWFAYITALNNGLWNDERAARQPITDKQHADKLLAEAKCAEAQNASAAAQQAMAAALRYAADNGDKPHPWSDEALIRQFMFGLAEQGVVGVAAVSKARASLLAYRLLYPLPVAPAPTGESP